MKIVHFLPWPSSNLIGGTELFVKKIAKSQILLGNQIFIVCPNIIDEDFFSLIDGIYLYKFRSPNPNNLKSISSGYVCPKNIFFWEKWLSLIKPDVLHVHVYEPYTFWYLKIAQKLCVNIYITPHIAQFSCISKGLLFNGIQKCNGHIDFKRCNQCFDEIFRNKNNNIQLVKKLSFFSKYIKYFLRAINVANYNLIIQKRYNLNRVKKIINKMIVLTNDYNDVLISNGFNQKEIIIAKYKFVNSVPNDNDINDCIIHIFKISFIGRMSKEKGVHVLIDSLTKLKVSNFSIELKLYGRQHEELFELDEIIEKAQSNNINIKWHGEIDTCEIEKVLHQSHVLCIPSTVYEMSPLVIQEAFSIGIPVVGSNIGGISEYIKHGENGLLFDTGNSIELAKCFQFLIDHPYEYNKLTRNVKKSLGLSQLGVDFVNIYKKYNAQ